MIRLPSGTLIGMRRSMSYAALAPTANGHLPLPKLVQTFPCSPKGHGLKFSPSITRILARAVVAATAELNVNTTSAMLSRRTVQNSALQLGKRTDIGLGIPGPPNNGKSSEFS